MQSPPVPLVRRHEKGSSQFRHFSGVGVISGNYVVAKRRGIIGGVDFLHTGEVGIQCLVQLQAHSSSWQLIQL